MSTPPPAPKKPMNDGVKSLILAVVVVGVVVVIAASGGDSKPSSTDDTSSLDQRVCEIGRDIAGSYNVTDTFSRTQERIADLYSGYGIAASPAISSAVRSWSAGMTSGDLTEAIAGIKSFDSACTSIGS